MRRGKQICAAATPLDPETAASVLQNRCHAAHWSMSMSRQARLSAPVGQGGEVEGVVRGLKRQRGQGGGREEMVHAG